jgi:two-component system, OmpR family, response regulator RegX3
VQVLLIEDDVTIASPLVRGLEREGLSVQHVECGADARAALAETEPDVVLLDLGLPDVDGFELCREMRATSNVPIIVVTARGEEIDRVVGLELGADDYVVKPFGFRELVARIRAVRRRAATRPGQPSPGLGPLLVDRRTRRAAVDDQPVSLTPKEFDLLALLADDPGAVCSRQRILDEVWDPHWYGATKTLDVHIASLRRKLGHPELIETVRGVGYRLCVPEAVA